MVTDEPDVLIRETRNPINAIIAQVDAGIDGILLDGSIARVVRAPVLRVLTQTLINHRGLLLQAAELGMWGCPEEALTHNTHGRCSRPPRIVWVCDCACPFQSWPAETTGSQDWRNFLDLFAVQYER